MAGGMEEKEENTYTLSWLLEIGKIFFVISTSDHLGGKKKKKKLTS